MSVCGFALPTIESVLFFFCFFFKKKLMNFRLLRFLTVDVSSTVKMRLKLGTYGFLD